MPRPATCDNCNSTRIELKQLKKHHRAYHRRTEWPYVYTCRRCQAECGLKRDTIHSVGTMVDIRTRHARALAHEAFDVLWRGGADKMPRSLAYKQLAAHMDFPIGNCHIGSMNYEQCQLVIKYSALIKRNRRGYRK